MKNVRKVRVFECVNWIGFHEDSPVEGQIYSEEYNWGVGSIKVGDIYDENGEGRFKLLGTIEVDCTPPTSKKSDLPKKRKFKLINGEGWRFEEGKIYFEDEPFILYNATQGANTQDWQEVFEQEKNVPLLRYPDPVYLSYDEVERGKWYDVREVLPDESFDGVLLTSIRGDGAFIRAADRGWVSVWNEDLGGFTSGTNQPLMDDVKEWAVY